MRWMKSETGQSIIEFALVLPMLMALCIGMAELGRATWAWNMAQMAASEGARRGIVIANGAWKDSVDAGVKSILYGKDGSTENMFVGYTVTRTVDQSVTPKLLVVDVKIPVTLFIKLFSSNGTYDIHGRATMPVQPAFEENAPTP